MVPLHTVNILKWGTTVETVHENKKIKINYSVLSDGLLDWKQPPREKAPGFQLNCSILVAFGVEIRYLFSFCPYFDSKFGQLFAWLPYINDMNKPCPFDEYSQSTTI